MAHTEGHARRGGGTGRRARGVRPSLPREAASTVAVVADESGFAMMRRYPTFRFDDHRSYLRHTEALLRALARRHGYTNVALFDPAAFADWCAEQGLDPDTAASRARYAGEIAARGATVPYEGQALHRLVPDLLAEHERWVTWEACTDLLAGAGDCPGCRAPKERCAFQRAVTALSGALQRTGPGLHHLVCSLATETGPLSASLHAELDADGAVRLSEPQALVLCTVLAAGMATGRPAGMVLRSTPPGQGGGPQGPRGPRGPRGSQQVRGWSLHGGRLRPLSEAEVFAAYCTDARTGEPVPPEPEVQYQAAPELPQGPCSGP